MEHSALQRMAVNAALRKMFENSYFDVCTLDTIAHSIGVNAKANPNYDLLRLIHCVNWSKMDPALRAEVPRLMADVLQIKPDQLSMVEEVRQAASPPKTMYEQLRLLVGGR